MLALLLRCETKHPTQRDIGAKSDPGQFEVLNERCLGNRNLSCPLRQDEILEHCC